MSDKSGIYAIRHIASGRVYIGSAVDLNRRRREHFRKLCAGSHCNSKLQNAWNKYGEDEFEFDVLEFCQKDVLILREQALIDTFDSVVSGFNILPIAGNTLGYRHSDETKRKLSSANSGYRHSEEAKESMRGRVVSDETRNALSIAHMGREMPQSQRDAIGRAHKGRKRTPEECAAISKGKTGKSRPPISEETRLKMQEAQKRRREGEAKNV